MNRVTADSNLYISAFLRGGKPLQLIDLARSGQIEIAVTDEILDEIGHVLGTKFRVSLEDIQEFRDEISRFAMLVSVTETLDGSRRTPPTTRSWNAQSLPAPRWS